MSRIAHGPGQRGHAANAVAARSTPAARAGLLALVLGAALIAWIASLQWMRGMDAGPGTDLGAFGWYLGTWVTMMAAMMLPSEAPTLLLFGSHAG
jgi:hypothetical protein